MRLFLSFFNQEKYNIEQQEGGAQKKGDAADGNKSSSDSDTD